jgi:nucleoside-diphosphate-sugar epimerase
MNILVTGGAGYLGSVLLPLLLERGHRVRVLDALLHGGSSLLSVWAHPSFEFVRGDIRDAEARATALAGVEAVVHLAAIVGDPACARNSDLATAVNRDASVALLADAETAGVTRFIFASTCSNYGKMINADRPLDETSELRPVSHYAVSKVEVERVLLGAAADGPVAPTVLRFSTLFGTSPRMRFDLTVNEFTMELMTKRRLQVFGEQFWRPYVHTRDAARAVLTVLDAPVERVRGQVYNVGSDAENYQKKQLIEIILAYAAGSSVEYVHRDEDPRDYRVSFAKMRSELGFVAELTVAQGIAEVARLVRNGLLANYDDPDYRN